MSDQTRQLQQGLRLSLITIAWNILEGIVAVIAAMLSGSVALLGFGVDSFVEVASACVVGWRLLCQLRGGDAERIEKAEGLASRIAGSLLLLLAAYLLVDSGRRLLGAGREPESSPIGMGLTILSLLVMPFLARKKLQIAAQLHSQALRADAYETIACAWLSAITLCGLGLNAALGWWWADPVAALALLPIIVREGLEGLRAEKDGCGSRNKSSGCAE